MFRLTMLASAAAAAGLLTACAGAPSQRALNEVRSQHNPVDRSTRTITNFTPALRCMDDLMFEIGTRDVTLMMEELRDSTTKVPVSARDMMTSAISDMTRRSRAVRLSVFGSDQQNLTQLLQQLQRNSAFEALPEYNLRGTISQLDEDVKRDSNGFGFVTEKLLGVRFGAETRFSVLGFDSAVVRTADMQLIPGVSSKNTTVIVRRDVSAADGQARILGANATFAFSTARSDGPSQAARNMVELAAIELVGKLIRAPYWQCLGTPDDHPEIARETEDWFLSMDPDERVVFFKERLRERRYYDGALDAVTDPAFDAALAAYRRSIGLADHGPIDLALFRQLVSRKAPNGPLAPLARNGAPRPAKVAAASTPAPDAETVTAAPAAGEAPAPVSGSAAGAVPPPASAAATATATAPATFDPAPALTLETQPVSGARQQLQLHAATAGYVYCYSQDPQSKTIRRIFPNRFMRDARVEAGASVRLPGTARFSIPASQQIACIHAPREVYGDLPAPLRWGDFDPVKLASFDEIRLRFAEASGQNVGLVRAR